MLILKLIDLSLRSEKLPSKTVAAFMKRLARVLVDYGCCTTKDDKIYILGLIANLMRRHPRCIRLIHRAKKRRSTSQ